jgi:hypothetical protein
MEDNSILLSSCNVALTRALETVTVNQTNRVKPFVLAT